MSSAEPSRLPQLFEAVAAAAASGRGPPPVHLWNPPRCGEIDIRILRDGFWLHEGSPIGRPAMVRLFASVLRRDPDGFCLVTPAEKLKITVEDAPFLAIGLESESGALRFATNVGDVVEAGPEHPIEVQRSPGGAPRPYVEVRGGLQALIARPVFYELAGLGRETRGPEGLRLEVMSNGCRFDLGSLEE
jgi:hypothetical protein